LKSEKRGLVLPSIIGIAHFLVFVVIAVSVLFYVSSLYPELKGLFQNTYYYMILFGTLIAFFATTTAYFNKGEISRMGSGIVKIFCLFVYTVSVYNNLDFTIELENFVANVSFPGLLDLKIGLLVLYGVYFVFEYFIYNKERSAEPDFLP